jgi:hypothetical protein
MRTVTPDPASVALPVIEIESAAVSRPPAGTDTESEGGVISRGAHTLGEEGEAETVRRLSVQVILLQSKVTLKIYEWRPGRKIVG